ncbi:hypothetical protein E1301_Tti020545 [Triplophysa tibetana]|uniref:EGF-like domain-containing protein n=1 Tax=Triplophysa tibetana TaxID=1572043 RepID=A0A5A9P098_9TELE|nr:hypothetical protein E1301_Tti020545 [Triplophysa tibetana]
MTPVNTPTAQTASALREQRTTPACVRTASADPLHAQHQRVPEQPVHGHQKTIVLMALMDIPSLSSGYSGDDCQTRVRDCTDDPCFNNATCVWTRDGYECQCVGGFEGQHCEEDIDECLSQPCRNGAICVDGIDVYQCYCVPGFQGYHCEIDINECASQPCENNGTCVNERDRYICECLNGFKATPCQNGATCHDHVGLHLRMLPGYEGINCELNIDECDSSPCLNAGRWVDLVNRILFWLYGLRMTWMMN